MTDHGINVFVKVSVGIILTLVKEDVWHTLFLGAAAIILYFNIETRSLHLGCWSVSAKYAK